MWIYDLFLVLFGIVIGVVAADPLKKIFTGKYRADKAQRKRVLLLSNLRKSPMEKKTAEQLNQEVFQGKEKEETVNQLLQEVSESGLIYSLTRHGKTHWIFNQETYDKNKHKFHS